MYAVGEGLGGVTGDPGTVAPEIGNVDVAEDAGETSGSPAGAATTVRGVGGCVTDTDVAVGMGAEVIAEVVDTVAGTCAVGASEMVATDSDTVIGTRGVEAPATDTATTDSEVAPIS